MNDIVLVEDGIALFQDHFRARFDNVFSRVGGAGRRLTQEMSRSLQQCSAEGLGGHNEDDGARLRGGSMWGGLGARLEDKAGQVDGLIGHPVRWSPATTSAVTPGAILMTVMGPAAGIASCGRTEDHPIPLQRVAEQLSF